MLSISRYTPELQRRWDEFVESAKNSTFMHCRGYMDYHSDRFADHSLMAWNGGRLVAVMPANEAGSTLYSHQGLTFGGWLVPVRHFNANTMLDLFSATLAYLKQRGFKKLVYKAVPHIYHKYPAEEDLYALFRNGARIITTNISSTVLLRDAAAVPFNERARRTVAKAEKHGIDVRESSDYAAFWDILTRNLAERYGAKPVHTLAEIELLRSRFPDNIKLYMAYVDGVPEAGAVVFESGSIAHTQYLSASESGYSTGASGLLFHRLVTEFYKDMRYFDFGTSNEDGGLYLNRNLLEAKSGYGARGIACNIYELDII